MSKKLQTLVIGFGSTLRGDDALGRIACERLRDVVDPRRVKVIDQAAPTPELAAEVAAAALVIFLDASVAGPAGEVVTHRLAAADPCHATAHSMNPQAIVALADRLYGHQPPAYLISFRGRSFDIGNHQLSSEAEAACALVVLRTLQLVEQEACTFGRNTPHLQVD